MMLNDRYEYDPIVDYLGEGGFAKVYRARDNLLGRKVALKFYSNDKQHDNKTLLREVQHAINLNHENLCQYYDVIVQHHRDVHGEMKEIQIAVLQYMSGGEIDKYLRYNPVYLDKLLQDTISGLHYMHKKSMIHRDIKPDNVLVDFDDNGIPVAKITDFGISKMLVSQHGKRSSSALIGTVEYMAPEQLSKTESIDHKVDIWAFGCLVYELVQHSSLFDPYKNTSQPILIDHIVKLNVGDKIKLMREPYRSIVNCCIQPKELRIGNISDLNSFFVTHCDSSSNDGTTIKVNEGEIIFKDTKFLDPERGKNEKTTQEKSNESIPKGNLDTGLRYERIDISKHKWFIVVAIILSNIILFLLIMLQG